MKKNIGNADRIVRLLYVAFIGFLYFSSIVTGKWSYLLLFSAAFALFTSFISYCPIYSLLGYSSAENNKQTV